MGSKAKAPATPDYSALATQQGSLNKETALQQWLLNNSPISTPYGTRETVADPNSASGYRVTETLNPADQARLDQQRQIEAGLMGLAPGALDYLGGVIGKPLNPGNLPPMAYGVDTGGLQYNLGDAGQLVRDLDMSGAPKVSSGEATRNRVENALTGRFDNFMLPKQQQAQAALENQIANKGGVTTSVAGRRAMNDLRKSQADERLNAGYEAILQGGNEATREYGMDMSSRQQAIQEMLARAGLVNQSQQQAYDQGLGSATFRNQAVQQNIGNSFTNANLANSSRAQGLQELMNLRQSPLNELMALLGGTQVAPTQFQQNSGVSWQAPNMYGAAQDTYNAQLAKSNASKAQQSGMLGGLFSLGGAALGGPMGAYLGKSIFG